MVILSGVQILSKKNKIYSNIDKALVVYKNEIKSYIARIL